jgi:hypothetical protein
MSSGNFEGTSTVGAAKSKNTGDSTREAQSSSEIPDSVQAPLLIVESFIDTFRRLRASDGVTGSYSESEGSLGHSSLISPTGQVAPSTIPKTQRI